MKVAFQGIKGAYSELALKQHFGNGVETANCETFDHVFKAVESDQVTYGFVPVENTIAGTVVENYDLMFTSELFIIAEFYMKIEHALLAKKGADIQMIKEAWSHPQALNQCKIYLKNNNIKMMTTYDTAGAAEKISREDRPDRAAIASELCARIYGLEILQRDIQTNRSNTTRFFVVAKEKNIPENHVMEKTTIAFKTRHYPGALVDCLKIFQKHNLNLTKLESRPVPENPWEYIFYAAFEGGMNSEKVKSALGEINLHALFVKLLGSYPMAEVCW